MALLRVAGSSTVVVLAVLLAACSPGAGQDDGCADAQVTGGDATGDVDPATGDADSAAGASSSDRPSAEASSPDDAASEPSAESWLPVVEDLGDGWRPADAELGWVEAVGAQECGASVRTLDRTFAAADGAVASFQNAVTATTLVVEVVDDVDGAGAALLDAAAQLEWCTPPTDAGGRRQVIGEDGRRSLGYRWTLPADGPDAPAQVGLDVTVLGDVGLRVRSVTDGEPSATSAATIERLVDLTADRIAAAAVDPD